MVSIIATEQKSYEASKLDAKSEAIPLVKLIINQFDIPVAPILLHRENDEIHTDLLQTLRKNS